MAKRETSRGRRLPGNRSGQVIFFTAFALLASLIIAGLAIDLGRFYVVRARLANAVDGGALAGARVLAQGEAFAENAARNFAGMNFKSGYMGTTGHSFSVTVDMNPDAPRILVSGNAVLPTTLMRLVGIDQVNVALDAEATRRPFAGALVLDTSGSMNGAAIANLRSGATAFLGFFDDTVDQMALVRYASGRIIPFQLGHGFTGPMTAAIAQFAANGATTAEDALAAGTSEVESVDDPTAFKALIFFTDGRPSSFRDNFRVHGVWYDAVIGGYPNPGTNGGDPPDEGLMVPTQVHQWMGVDNPTYLPDGRRARNTYILEVSRTQTRQAANAARENGITIYSIALGNPGADQWNRPDAALLIELANLPSYPDPFGPGTIVNPNYDPSQPTGGFFFTPSAPELQEIFERIAREISIRLTR